jgi:hypothetical protein
MINGHILRTISLVVLLAPIMVTCVPHGTLIEGTGGGTCGPGVQISNASPAAGNPAAYVRSDCVNAIPHIDVNVDDLDAGAPVTELYLGQNGWSWGSLSDLSRAPPGVGNPAAYVRSDGVNAVVYWATDGDLHEISLKHGGSGWADGDLMVSSLWAPNCNGHHSNPAAYVRSDSANAVVYCCTDTGTVWEIYLLNGATCWQYAAVTSSGAPGCHGDVVAYQRSDGVNAVLYVSPPTVGGIVQNREDIWELASKEPTQDGWSSLDLSLSAAGDPDGGELAESVLGPSGWVQAHVLRNGTNSVVYVGGDQNVHELYLPLNGRWGYRNLALAAGGAPLAATRVFGFNRSDGVTSYVFWDTGQHLQEITLAEDGQTWGHDLIPTAGTANANGDFTAYVRNDSVNAVMFYGVGGESASGQDIFQAFLAPGATSWELLDVTERVGEPVY